MYSSRLLNFVEQNYTTTEKKTLAMVYALQKFRHYLLGNMFTFFVDHMALVYLTNKPHVSCRLGRYLLLFLKYNFKIVYKPSISHLMVDALNRLPNHTKPIGISDQTCDAHMFTLQSEWLQSVYEYLLKGMMLKTLITSHMQYLTQRANPFMLQKGALYKCTPKLLVRLKCEYEGENNGKSKSGDTLSSSQHF
jgi:hypothetical protein